MLTRRTEPDFQGSSRDHAWLAGAGSAYLARSLRLSPTFGCGPTLKHRALAMPYEPGTGALADIGAGAGLGHRSDWWISGASTSGR
jgi:hypothetical protein